MTDAWLPRDADDVGTGEAVLEDGTRTRIQVRVDRETRRIDDAVFKVVGGEAALASARLVAERLRGATVDGALEMDALAIVAELGLPIERAKAAALAVEAAHRAVMDWEAKR